MKQKKKRLWGRLGLSPASYIRQELQWDVSCSFSAFLHWSLFASILRCNWCKFLYTLCTGKAQDDLARTYKEVKQLPDIRCLRTKQESYRNLIFWFRGMVVFSILSVGLFPFLAKEKLIYRWCMITLQPQWASSNACCVLLSMSGPDCAAAHRLCGELAPLCRARLHQKAAFTEHEGFLLYPAVRLPAVIHPAD